MGSGEVKNQAPVRALCRVTTNLIGERRLRATETADGQTQM